MEVATVEKSSKIVPGRPLEQRRVRGKLAVNTPGDPHVALGLRRSESGSF